MKSWRDAAPPSTWVCNPGHPNQEYGASDFYFGNEQNDRSVTVCGWSQTDDNAAPCVDGEEILLETEPFESCGNGAGTTNIAVAIYYEP